ncbi:hypothetical protein ACEWY4_019834 [Coilia grayii]|uniref:Integrase core domain-containing protein n=1 Tax=Coilia grayii TaxID=363190 RepID=A0ABD1JC30_9TELE
MASLEAHGHLLKDMFATNNTYAEMSSTMSQLGVRGCSEMSVRRFCTNHNLRQRGQVSDARLEVEINKAIDQTGSTYGRKLMTGYLSSVGIQAGERHVGNILRTVNPVYHDTRRRGARNLNPTPYYAGYTGHKLHIDQNEKLGMFGVTHVMAVDGYSKKVVSHATMPIKNNLIIYEDVYRPAVLQYGMWDQVRVDHGREFYLTLYMQEMLSPYRFNLERKPYLQTQSTNNHTIERMWPEVNSRVNYSIKAALIQLLDQETIDMDNSLTKYCVSNFTVEVCKIGIKRVTQAWNAHKIPGKGIPNILASGGCPTKITQDLLPHAAQAADYYQHDIGSSLTRLSCFGADPFSTELHKIAAEDQFAENYADISVLFDCVVNHNPVPFQEALLKLIDITRQYA